MTTTCKCFAASWQRGIGSVSGQSQTAKDQKSAFGRFFFVRHFRSSLLSAVLFTGGFDETARVRMQRILKI